MSEKEKDSNSPLLEQMVKENKNLRLDRARIIESSINRAEKALIMNIENALDEKKSQLLQLRDFGPDNTTDLRVGTGNFNAPKFVSRNLELRMEIRDLTEQLEEAKSMLKEDFDE